MITDIRLQNFRSYQDSIFEFGDGVNIIVGPNASGKTNLLEALMIVCAGRSYRTKGSEIINYEKSWARLDAHTKEGQRTAKFSNHTNQVLHKTFNVDGQSKQRIPHTKTLPVVLFEPEHLQLLSGPPELRRDFLDDLLTQITVGYSKLRKDYSRTLTQRNALLKRGLTTAHGQLFAWDVRLSELGGQVAQNRAKLTKQLNQGLAPIYKKLSYSHTEATMAYRSSLHLSSYSSHMLRKLESNQALDLARGFTTYGPHRDDLEVILNGHRVQHTASRGEKRTLTLALKILELKLLEKERDQKPILLLDDVFSELDGKRRQALTKFLKNYQTFITTTDADVVVQHFIGKATIIPITK